jgi:hypothetical protein
MNRPAPAIRGDLRMISVARLDCRIEQPQATCFSAWSLTADLHNTSMKWAGHVLQHVVHDFQPNRTRRPEVSHHALKHVACQSS